MERALKERIVGAIVLVVFIVLVVPVFLDGPADDVEVLSETVTLPGQNGQPSKRQTIVLERDRTEPLPVVSTPEPEVQPERVSEEREEPASPPPSAVEAAPVDDPPAQTAAVQQEAPPAEPERVEPEPEPQPQRNEPPPAVSSTTGMWAVQLGSFSNKDNAERLASELRGKGYAAFLSQLQSAGKQLHRVRVGPQKDRASAEDIAQQLARGGHRGQVVPHP